MANGSIPLTVDLNVVWAAAYGATFARAVQRIADGLAADGGDGSELSDEALEKATTAATRVADAAVARVKARSEGR